MSKRKTISQRWYAWNKLEPQWSYSALACFALAMLGLTIHLSISGVLRTIGLFMLIGFDIGLLTITFLRKQMWWFTFFCYITVGVIGWEIASYFFGG
jgi:type III secretory pathway component EscU